MKRMTIFPLQMQGMFRCMQGHRTAVSGAGARLKAGAVLLAGLVAPALAFAGAGGVADLREALDHVPRGVLGTGADWISFNGTAQISRVLDGQEAAANLVLGQGAPMDALGADRGSAFADKAGVSLQELRYLLQFGQPPHELVLWGMRDRQALDTLLAGLPERGFAAAGDGVLKNGEAGAMDLTLGDPANPWRGMMGRSYAVAARDRVLIQASSARAALALADQSLPMLAEDEAVATALAGVQDAVAAGELAQAIVASPALGLQPDDPLLRDMAQLQSLAAVRDKDQERTAGRQTGSALPLFAAVILADVRSGAQAELVISAAYASCDKAEPAALLLAERWSTQFGAQLKADVTGAAVASPQGCAAVARVKPEDRSTDARSSYALTLQALMRRDLRVLRVGD